MTRNQSILAILVAAAVAWGCGKTQTPQPAAAVAPSQQRALEAKVAKLEQDVRTVEAKLADAETRLVVERSRGQGLERERDRVLADLRVRTTERDAVQGQFDGFRKSLKDLLGQMEAAAVPSLPAVSAPALPPGGSMPTAVHASPPPRGL